MCEKRFEYSQLKFTNVDTANSWKTTWKGRKVRKTNKESDQK